ncbi:MAG: PAS domain S-box protein [Spirochaetia bacterium]|nr:PAS domain S-box protein [Spirochaetia bacterium]
MKTDNLKDIFQISQSINREFVNSLPQIIIEISSSGSILFTNQKALKVLGYKKKAFLKLNIFDLLVSTKKEDTKKNIQKIIRKLKPSDSKFNIIKHDKKLIPSQIYFIPQKKNRNITSIWCVVTDTSEVYKLQEESTKLLKAVEYSPSTILITNKAGKIEYANQKFCEQTGYSLSEIIGKNPRMFKSGQTERKVYIDLWMHLYNQKEWRGEFINKKKNGEIYIEEARIAPIIDSTGKTVNYVAFKDDITVQRKAQKEIEKYMKALERVNKYNETLNHFKQLFIDIIRHDILNSAFSIDICIKFILEAKSEKEQKEAYEILLNTSKQLIDLIENTAKFSNLEDISKIDFKLIDLNQILTTAVKNNEKYAKEKNLKIINLAKGKFAALVNPLLTEVFSNVISNSIKYASNSEKIEIDIKKQKENYIISFADFGEGVPDEYKKKIFERFERHKKEGILGTGLGLAICKRIVEFHEGKIWVEDNPMGGSIFKVNIPKNKK